MTPENTPETLSELNKSLAEQTYQYRRKRLQKIIKKEVDFFKVSIELPNNMDFDKGISFRLIHQFVIDMYTQHSKRKFWSLDRTFDLPGYPTYYGQSIGRTPVFITSDMEFAQKLQSFLINLKRGDVEPNIINLHEYYQYKAVYPLLLNLFKNGEQHTHSLPSLTGIYLKINLDYISDVSNRLRDNGLKPHSLLKQSVNMPEYMKNIINYCNASWFDAHVSQTNRSLDLNINSSGVDIKNLFSLKKNHKTGQYCIPLLSHDKEYVARCENLIEAICLCPEDAIEQCFNKQLLVDLCERFIDFYSDKKRRDALVKDIKRERGTTRSKIVGHRQKI